MDEIVIVERDPEPNQKELITRYENSYGKDADFFIASHPLHSMVVEETTNRNVPSTWAQLALHQVNLHGKAEDPTPLHFSNCRRLIQIEKDEASNDVVDKFSRDLLTLCQEFRKQLINQEILENLSEDFLFQISPMGDEEVYVRDIDGVLWFDAIFIEFIASIGHAAKKIAQELNDDAKERYATWKSGKGTLHDVWALWVNPSDPLNAPFLLPFAKALWEVQIKSYKEKVSRNIPALTKAVLTTTIKPPLSKDVELRVEKNHIECYESGKLICTVPCIDTKLVNLITKGIESFSSLTGHKLLRWQVRTGFNNWVHGVEDPRLICTTGGYEGIADLIGCGKSKKSPTEVKAILHAQAHGHFVLPQGGSGNMIILNKGKFHKNGEPWEIKIVLGEMLLPNFAHLLPHGEKRRLVPITDLPPLIGSKNTHAQQAMLQILVLEEFSNQSNRLFEQGSICIPFEKWKELAKQAKLPLTSLQKVLTGWTHDDLFAKAFLDKQGDDYVLAASHAPVVKFLSIQGKQRLDGEKAGIKSSEKKKELSEKGYSKKARAKM
jgi:hypothetical protein